MKICNCCICDVCKNETKTVEIIDDIDARPASQNVIDICKNCLLKALELFDEEVTK